MERDLGFGAYYRAEYLYRGKWQVVYGSRPVSPCPLAGAFFFPFFFPRPLHIE